MFAGDVEYFPMSVCSAKMMWHGPNLRYNKPEARRFTLIIKNSMENQLMRELGIQCLADHEIGTHYVSFGIVVNFQNFSENEVSDDTCTWSTILDADVEVLISTWICVKPVKYIFYRKVHVSAEGVCSLVLINLDNKFA